MHPRLSNVHREKVAVEVVVRVADVDVAVEDSVETKLVCNNCSAHGCIEISRRNPE